MSQYERAIKNAEEAKLIVEEYLMGPESVQFATVIVEYLQSWEFLLLVGMCIAYRVLVRLNWVAKVTARALAKIEEAE